MRTIKTWLATLAVLLCSISASAHDFEVNGIYYNILSAADRTVEVTYNNSYIGSYTGNITIPNSVTYNTITYSVTSIGYQAFINCPDLTSVFIGNGVTSIGSNAFWRCFGLTSIVVEDGNPVYDSRDNCNAIIETATNALFRGCATTTIPNGVSSIKFGAFRHCSGLTSIAIPNSVSSIGDYAFASCSGLTSIAIPNSVTSIGDYAFEDCAGLTSIAIPNSVTSIGYDAFYECSGLTSIVVEDGNLVYDSRNNCNAIIESATNTLLLGSATTIIPNSVTSIGYEAFYGCKSLTSITIPNSVSSIGDYAFASCSGLTSIAIPNSVTSIGRGAFAGCKGLTSVTIPNSVTSIGSSAFSGCTGLTSVTIPNRVTRIEFASFYGCKSLTSITIPNSVMSIDYDAFNGCSSLTSIFIPNSVKHIGYLAFQGCTSLTSITIPNSVTSIGYEAFAGCSVLTSVIIPNSVTSISFGAFSRCPELFNVYCYAENVPSADSDVFADSYPENATLHVPAAALESYKSTSPWSCFGNIVALPPSEVTLEDGVEYENNTEAENVPQITYTRTLPNLQWNALFVPFEIPVSDLADDYDVAYINDIHSYDKDLNGEIDQMEMEVIYIKEGTLHANHPYLIRAKSDDAKAMSIVVTDATLYSSAKADRTSITCSSAYTDFEVIGTYEKMTAQELDGCYAINTSGAWSPIAAGSYLNPFRLYMTITSRNGSPVKVSQSAMSRINIRVQGEDNATGITETENTKVKTENFDLSGRRVERMQKGIYIVNGKKVVR